jgi:hypothetical protein
MKTNIVAFAGIGLLAIFALAFVSIFEIRLASAQVDASSSLPLTTDTTTVPQVLEAPTSTVPTNNDASSTAASTPTSKTPSAAAAATSTAPAPAVEQPPQGLTEVHIIGTKYTDYFTDGTTVTGYPGDPAIDSHFSEPNAPIPTHAGLTWVHTTGQYLYDTPTGDLDVGDYAVQSDGSYIENAFVSSTSTPAVSSPTDSTSAAPAVLGASTSTAPAGSDTFIPPGTWTATNTDSIASPPPDAAGSSSAASAAPATTTGS